jgi:hypothetical protein
MPFHVEISSPFDCARVLNLDEMEVREAVLEPWVAGLPFEFGARDWAPRESRLTILEGPALRAAGHDEGWESALRAAEDVTRPMLEAAEASAPTQTAVAVEANSVDAALKELRAGGRAPQIPWATAVERIAARDPEIVGVILVVKRSGLSRPRL